MGGTLAVLLTCSSTAVETHPTDVSLVGLKLRAVGWERGQERGPHHPSIICSTLTAHQSCQSFLLTSSTFLKHTMNNSGSDIWMEFHDIIPELEKLRCSWINKQSLQSLLSMSRCYWQISFPSRKISLLPCRKKIIHDVYLVIISLLWEKHFVIKDGDFFPA